MNKCQTQTKVDIPNCIKTKEEIERDNYYNYLFKKYKCYDMDDIIDIITDEENEIRERLETACM